MATTVTITTTDEEDAAIVEATSSNPAGGQTPTEYITNLVSATVGGLLRQYRVNHAPLRLEEAVNAYLNASPEVQQQIKDLLSVE